MAIVNIVCQSYHGIIPIFVIVYAVFFRQHRVIVKGCILCHYISVCVSSFCFIIATDYQVKRTIVTISVFVYIMFVFVFFFMQEGIRVRSGKLFLMIALMAYNIGRV